MNFDRVVLDTNIYISTRRVFIADIFFKYGKTIYSCQQQIDEYLDVVKRKKISEKYIIKPDTQIFYDVTILTEIDERYDKGPMEDRYLIDLCYTIKADYLVTLDHGLLELKHVGKIQIIDLAYFKKLLLRP
jgi:predicted nucleic acid-binding protein